MKQKKSFIKRRKENLSFHLGKKSLIPITMRDPHLVVEAAFQHHHGDNAGGVSRWKLRVCPRTHCLHVGIHHRPKVVPPLPGCPAFPVHEAIVQRDVEGVGAELRRCSCPASRFWCRLGFGCRGDERVC